MVVERRAFLAWVALSIVAPIGCVPTTTPAPPLNSVEYFKLQQKQTMTPHGRVLADGARLVNGKVQYQTDQDGLVRTWRVDAIRQTDGTFRFGEPVEVK